MIRLLLLQSITLVFFACERPGKITETKPQAIAASALDTADPVVIPSLGYDSLLQIFLIKKKALASRYASAAESNNKAQILDESRRLIYKQLTQQVWPAWYGTPWDFNGTSNKPREGEIACGYFVSTTLKHIGFNLNRYRLAQQGATAICKAFTSKLKRFSSVALMEEYLKKQSGNHLYIIGLDYHVGFIQQQDSSFMFTHASYYDPVAVISQRFDESSVLHGSNSYVLASFLESDALVENWLKGKQIYPKP